jgi:hypothetical protein
MCSTEQPFVCAGDAPPGYDCTMCGCPDGQVCQQSVCQPADLESHHSESLGISLSLGIEDYFGFADAGMTGDLSLAALNAEIERLLAEDARRSTILLGESHGSDDEQAVARAVVRAAKSAGWTFGRMGIEGGGTPIFDGSTLADVGITPFGISGDLTNLAYCKAAVKEAATLLNTDHLYVQYTGSGHTSREACYHPEQYTICNPPHTAECLTAKGRKPITVMLVDPEPWLSGTDNALLWRAGNLLPDAAAFEAELTASIAAFDKHMAAQTQDAPFDAMADGRAVNMRARKATHAPDVFIAFFPRLDRPARLMRTFKAVWDDPQGKAWFLDNAVKPQDCSISWDLTPGAEMNGVNCDNNGKMLEATIDGNTYALKSLTVM